MARISLLASDSLVRIFADSAASCPLYDRFSTDKIVLHDGASVRRACELLIENEGMLVDALVESYELNMRSRGSDIVVRALPSTILVEGLLKQISILNEIKCNAHLFVKDVLRNRKGNLEISLYDFASMVSCGVWLVVYWRASEMQGFAALWADSNVFGQSLTNFRLRKVDEALTLNNAEEQPLLPSIYSSHPKGYAWLKYAQGIISQRYGLAKPRHEERRVMAARMNGQVQSRGLDLAEGILSSLGLPEDFRLEYENEPSILAISNLVDPQNTVYIALFFEEFQQKGYLISDLAEARAMLALMFPITECSKLERSIKSSVLCGKLGKRKCPQKSRTRDLWPAFREARSGFLSECGSIEESRCLCEVEKLLRLISATKKPFLRC
jgi:hypothetical protein